jgi:hypothetical protein
VRERVADAEFPETPGAYVVYGEADEPPLYVGVAASQTIAKRWRTQHLRPRAGGSALRRTLGVHLRLVGTKLRTSEGRYYPAEVEAEITRYLEACGIEFHPARDAADARALEDFLIADRRPTLNVRGPSVEARAKRALAAGLSAMKPDVGTDARGYVRDVSDNLLADIRLADIVPDFSAGAGNELESKMLAPWSSSALAVNAFARWRDDLDKLVLAGLSGFSPPLAFEVQCAHGVRGERPHLDLLLCHERGVLGVESKCLEHTRSHARAVVADAYRALARRGDQRASSRWFAVLDHVGEFHHLDAYQLVKHYLGLAHSYPEVERTLVYIYWEPTNDESLFAAHRNEVERFADMVAGDMTCAFTALSYGAHWRELERSSGPSWVAEHLRSLRMRYAVPI